MITLQYGALSCMQLPQLMDGVVSHNGMLVNRKTYLLDRL